MEDPESLQNVFREALQKSLTAARTQAFKVEFRAGVDTAGNEVYVGPEQFIEQFNDGLRDENEDVTTLAGQLLHLFSVSFPPDRLQSLGKVFASVLAVKANHVRSGKLWPEGCWLNSHYQSNPAWLSPQEMANVQGVKVKTYKQLLHHLGYGPVRASSKDALDQIWHSLHHSPSDIQTCNADRYAVVSYVQYAEKRAPTSWAAEVDAVLTALVDMDVISEKAIWFDKLASRQYRDSQKWWAATATMQFLFNPVIVILPRVSEREAFAKDVRRTLWGSEQADNIFFRFVGHAKACSKCQECYVLEWALKQDYVMPSAALRTWPRVEHLLGAHGFGLFTSETTYAALAALLTCFHAMLSTLLSGSGGTKLPTELLHVNAVPSSTYVKADGSVQVGWVHTSCTSNWLQSRNPVRYIAALREMGSLSAELVRLFCHLHTPKLLARSSRANDGVDLRSNIDASSGLYYPAEDSMRVDVPMMIRFNTNELRDANTSYTVVSSEVFSQLQMYWAYVSMSKNFHRVAMKDINSVESLVARRKAVEVLVYGQARKAPCFSWDDKLVAVILLSTPNVFLEAVDHWYDQVKLSNLTRSFHELGILDESQEIEWLPNTLIAVLAVTGKQSIHRLISRFVPIKDYRRVRMGTLRNAANDHHVQAARVTTAKPQKLGGFSRLCRSLLPCGGDQTGRPTKKCFLGYFAGQMPLVTVDALPFKSSLGTNLPALNDYVYRKLQEASVRDSNMVVVGQPWTDSYEQKAGQCWYCQMLLALGLGTPGVAQAPPWWLSRSLVSGLIKLPPGMQWGLGTFDPLNAFSLFDADIFFGLYPDSVAVLLERHGRHNSLHATTTVFFGLLAASQDSKQVSTCATCFNVIVYDYDPSGSVLEHLWTLTPLLGDDLDAVRNWGTDVIR